MTQEFHQFLHPWFLVLLPLPFILLVWNYKRKGEPTVLFSDLSIAKGLPRSFKQWLLRLLPWTRCAVLCLGIIALARPQHGIVQFESSSLGVDIALVLDVSGSMQENDFYPNRLEAAKTAASTFAEGRTTDRVGVVLYGSSAGILVPPTLDMQSVQTFIASIQDGIIEKNSTAIGDGLALGVKMLADAEKKDAEKVLSRVVVLLTDGVNNAGKVAPMQAAEIAKSLDVTVHTIGVGGGRTMFSLQQSGSFDEETLRAIAKTTGGQYFHARDEKNLVEIYREIDQMEKSKIETEQTSDYNENFMWFWFPALALLGIEFILRALYIRRLP